MIYYTVLEAALSELEEVYIVVNEGKDSLRRYLEQGELDKDLQEQGEGGRIRSPHITFVDQPVGSCPRPYFQACVCVPEIVKCDP